MHLTNTKTKVIAMKAISTILYIDLLLTIEI
jgi:hypothetical protein